MVKTKIIKFRNNTTNNLLDFQNYILLETGYPFEFYDLEKFLSNLIIQILIYQLKWQR
jgi:phenylalanyl-tRNA synthetase beta subunit